MLGVSGFEQFLRFLELSFEMRELFLIQLRADLNLLRIWFAAQATQETELDHLGQITLGFEMQFLTQHTCSLDILDTVEQNERLER